MHAYFTERGLVDGDGLDGWWHLRGDWVGLAAKLVAAVGEVALVEQRAVALLGEVSANRCLITCFLFIHYLNTQHYNIIINHSKASPRAPPYWPFPPPAADSWWGI